MKLFIISVLFVEVSFAAAKSSGCPNCGAVVTNGLECAAIARQMFDEGGSVADAIIAAMICEGIASAQSTGLGGGFFMTIYIKERNEMVTLDARDVAPLAATKDMFVNRPVTGVFASSVPGELKGYWELHKRYGKLPWYKLFEPNIELCLRGNEVTSYIAKVLKQNEQDIRNSTTLAEIYINSETNELYQEGDFVKRPKLAQTLAIIAIEGVDTMYGNGTIARLFVEDLQNAGGIVTIEDLLLYNVRWRPPIAMSVRGVTGKKTIYTLPLPSGGPLVQSIMNVLDTYRDRKETVLSLHRIIETFKFSFAKRPELGDPEFAKGVTQVVENIISKYYGKTIHKKINDCRTYNNTQHYEVKSYPRDDHGTSHINIIAPNGDAIACTGSINYDFGAKAASPQTGIIFNNGMGDFSTPGTNTYGLPPSTPNFIQPRKIPLSSMCPTIMLDENRNVELAVGAAGGSQIITSVALTIARVIYFNKTIEKAIRAPRVSDQLIPMQVDYERGLKKYIIRGLRKKGHKMNKNSIDSSVTGIQRRGGDLFPYYDPRRGGGIEIID